MIRIHVLHAFLPATPPQRATQDIYTKAQTEMRFGWMFGDKRRSSSFPSPILSQNLGLSTCVRCMSACVSACIFLPISSALRDTELLDLRSRNCDKPVGESENVLGLGWWCVTASLPPSAFRLVRRRPGEREETARNKKRAGWG